MHRLSETSLLMQHFASDRKLAMGLHDHVARTVNSPVPVPALHVITRGGSRVSLESY
jgi:hypothetical protein